MSTPYDIPTPGQMLWEDYMEPEGITITEMAHKLGTSKMTISRLVGGHSAISVEMATRLFLLLGTSAQYWLNLQNQHDLRKVDTQSIKAEMAV